MSFQRSKISGKNLWTFFSDMQEVRGMCKACGCKDSGKPVQFKCDCDDDCSCTIIEFDEEPKAVPYCCGAPMKRIK